jgi:CRP-like cAMP-binding protein
MSPASLPTDLAVLQTVPLFQDLALQELDRIASVSRRQKVESGGYFFMEGDPADRLLVLLEGRVKLSQVTLDGQQVIMGYIGSGQDFGVIAVLDEVDYPVSAEALVDCLALSWEQADMQHLMDEIPRLARNALRSVSNHMREFQSRIRELSTQRVERRIARTLLRLAQQTGRKVEDGVLIDLPLTRQDLAEMTGATLFTVSRTLKRWEKLGLVRSKRAQVTIRFPHGLVRIAEDFPD